MCDIWKSPDKREVSQATVQAWSLAWKSADIKNLVLTGGEPLLHSAFASLLGQLAYAGFTLSVVTNGLRLADAAEEIAVHCGILYVSLDGPPEIHNRIRAASEAIEHLGAGIAAIKTINHRVKIVGRCTVQRSNVSSLRETVQTARRLGFDAISFLAADVSTGVFCHEPNAITRRRDAILPSITEVALLEQQIEALASDFHFDFQSHFIQESPNQLAQILVDHFRAIHGIARFPLRPCRWPWLRPVIETDGIVRPCFFHKPYGRLSDDTDLNAVLNSRDACDFRANLNVNTDPVCERCVCRLI